MMKRIMININLEEDWNSKLKKADWNNKLEEAQKEQKAQKSLLCELPSDVILNIQSFLDPTEAPLKIYCKLLFTDMLDTIKNWPIPTGYAIS